MDTDDFIVKRIPKAARPFVVIGAGIVLQATYGIVYTFGNDLFVNRKRPPVAALDSRFGGALSQKSLFNEKNRIF